MTACHVILGSVSLSFQSLLAGHFLERRWERDCVWNEHAVVESALFYGHMIFKNPAILLGRAF